MGLDIKAAGDAMADMAARVPSLDSLNSLLPASPVLTQIGVYFGLISAVYLFFRHTSAGKRTTSTIEETVFSNWQLTLLASTGIALSLASGYTTFDGLTNFTGAPLLSVFISFGIQGVMLIVAWLIGESFAAGMNQRSARRPAPARWSTPASACCSAWRSSASPFYWLLHQYSAVSLTEHAGLPGRLVRFADVGGLFPARRGAGRRARLRLPARRRHLARPTCRALRLIVKNAVLWVMFLASMAASVFFSFDSHFNAIFPAEQRKRAAEIRTANQIGGVVADIGALTAEAPDRGGRAAVRHRRLEGLRQAAREPRARPRRARRARSRNTSRSRWRSAAAPSSQQQERIATAQSGQAGLASKKISLTDELSRLEGRAAGRWPPNTPSTRAELDAKAKEIDAKRVEAHGRGPRRRRHAQAGQGAGLSPAHGRARQRCRTSYKIKEERAKDAQKRLGTAETRIAQIERELATIDGDLAKLKGEAETAEQRIKLRRRPTPTTRARKLDPGPRAAGLRARARRLPPAARHRAAGGAAAAVRAICSTPCRARRRPRTEGARHRLRSQAGGRGGRARVRAQCRPRGLPDQLRRRRQARRSARPPTRCSASAASACRTSGLTEQADSTSSAHEAHLPST